MKMFNPPHPGETLLEIFLIPQKINQNTLAEKLGLSLSTFQLLLEGVNPIDREIANRLSTALGTSSEMWLAMQKNYDEWQAEHPHP